MFEDLKKQLLQLHLQFQYQRAQSLVIQTLHARQTIHVWWLLRSLQCDISRTPKIVILLITNEAICTRGITDAFHDCAH